jgi:hypothetical protein
MLVKDAQVQLVGPPVAVRCASAGCGAASFAGYRTFAFVAHLFSPFLKWLEWGYMKNELKSITYAATL